MVVDKEEVREYIRNCENKEELEELKRLILNRLDDDGELKLFFEKLKGGN